MGKVKKQRGSNAVRGNPDKIKGQGFHTDPDRINKKGRPRLIRIINEELEARGYEKFSESQLVDTYKSLLQLTEKELKAMAADESNPFFIRRVIHYMGSQKGMEMLDRMLDRSFGRAKQIVESSVKMDLNLEPIPEDRQQILNEFRAKLNELDEPDKV